MRTRARFPALVAVIFCAAGLAGCQQVDQIFHGDSMRMTQAAPMVDQERPIVRRAARSRSVLKRVAQPRVVAAGARIRGFCGQRHVRFQSGSLRESATEKARNDVLCSQSR